MCVQSAGRRFTCLHIPKNGGTSVCNALLQAPGMVRRPGSHHVLLSEVDPPADHTVVAIVRNPWDRMVSFYNMFMTTPKPGAKALWVRRACEGFGDWLRKDWFVRYRRGYIEGVRVPQMNWLIDGEMSYRCDYVGRFEDLESSYAEICRLAGIDLPPELPHIRSGDTEPHAHYSAYYEGDEEAVELVRGWHAADIEAFGYEFERAAVGSTA